MSAGARIRISTLVIIAMTAGLHLAWGDAMASAPTPHELPWWLLAALFYVAEVLVVQVQLGREAQSVSLTEIPLVIGLFFLGPQDLVLAQAVGTAAALAVRGRHSPMRLVYTISYRALGTTIAALAFQSLASGASPVRPPAWVAAAAAAVLSAVVYSVAATHARALKGDAPPPSKWAEMFGLGMLSTLANTTVGLAEATLLWVSPNSAWLAAGLTGMLYLAYRAYWAERRKHESVELLYETSKILQQPGDLESIVVALLWHLRKLFRADSAQLILYSTTDAEGALSTHLGPSGEREIMRRVSLPEGSFPSDNTESAFGIELVRSSASAGYRKRLPVHFTGDAMVVGLRNEGRRVGILVIGDRSGEVTTFDREDQKLFSALANHVTAAIENGRLERSLARLTQLEQQLRHQAFHDPLTGLANRVLFHERVQHALDRRGAKAAVLFVDLDGFKNVNDVHGHAAGDRVLVAAAERMRTCLRPGDTAARLSGDEFAILLEDIADTETARRVGARVVELFGVPFSVGDGEVRVGASCGVAVADHNQRADELLANADKAMYKVKSQGKGRYTLFEPAMQWESI
jgi:diguanylate cyclase (GGDEF)-like protein